MGRTSKSASILPCIGMVAGVLLLSFASVIVLMAPSLSVADLRADPQPAHQFLPASPRRMQAPVVFTGVSTTTTATTHDSSFDSSDESSSSQGSSSSIENSLDSSKSSEPNWSLALPLPVEQAIGAWLPYHLSMLFEILFMICFSVCYKRCAVDVIIDEFGTIDEPVNEGKDFLLEYRDGAPDFRNPICGCLGDTWVTIHGCFCPIPRMAHTNAVAGISGYWETMVCFSCCALCTGGIAPCCLMVYWRRRVKEVMGIDDNFFKDCVITVLCPLLSLCQQGTAVDRAMGYTVTGCCDVTPTGY